MDPLVWAGLLLLVGLILVMTEVFVPSGGILGLLSVTAILAAIVMAFYYRGAVTGIVFVLVALLSVPTILVFAFRWLPDTAVGKRLLATVPTSEEVLPDDDERRMLRSLVGKVGRAKTADAPQRGGRSGRTIQSMPSATAWPLIPGNRFASSRCMARALSFA